MMFTDLLIAREGGSGKGEAVLENYITNLYINSKIIR